jgi:hypothetical protein
MRTDRLALRLFASLTVAARDKKGPLRRVRVRWRRWRFFSLAPGRRLGAWKAVSGSVGASFQDLFFHKSEIISLDSENPRKAGRNAENRNFFVSFEFSDRANRGKSSVF